MLKTIYFISVYMFAIALLQLQACAQTKPSSMKKLIYVMDAQCGWCYGNSNNVAKLQEQFKNEYEFEILVGGMWLEDKAPVGGEQLSQFLQKNAPRMSSTTGAEVSDKFYQLAKETSYKFSSLEPNAAISLVKELAPNKVFQFAKKVQSALYIEGKRLDKLEIYIPILDKMLIDKQAFKSRWMKEDNLSKTKAEFEESGKFANSFPTLLLQTNDKTEVVASGYFNLEEVIQRLK